MLCLSRSCQSPPAAPEFVSLNICERERAILSFPPDVDRCQATSLRLGQAAETRNISGFDGYNFVVVRRVFNFSLSTILSFVLTLICSSFAVGLAYAMSRRFRQDILRPLKSDFDSEIPTEIQEFIDLKSRLSKLLKLESEKAEAEIARQVAHDIRSPLSALNILLQTRKLMLPPGDLDLMQSIYTRIHSISENLLKKTRGQFDTRLVLGSFNQVQVGLDRATFSKTVETVLEEKRLLHPYLLFKVEHSEGFNKFKGVIGILGSEVGRIISNLLNNSIEASKPGAKVSLTTDVDEIAALLIFSVRDQGCGMDEARLQMLRTQGGTFGKESGNGLGLSHLKSTMIQCGGAWHINSWPGRGTTVEIRIPITVEKFTAPESTCG